MRGGPCNGGGKRKRHIQRRLPFVPDRYCGPVCKGKGKSFRQLKGAPRIIADAFPFPFKSRAAIGKTEHAQVDGVFHLYRAPDEGDAGAEREIIIEPVCNNGVDKGRLDLGKGYSVSAGPVGRPMSGKAEG